MFAQPTAEGTRMLPGANGGQEWSPVAVNPELQYAYSVALHQPMIYKTHYAPYERGRLWLGSAFVAIPGEAASTNANGKKRLVTIIATRRMSPYLDVVTYIHFVLRTA